MDNDDVQLGRVLGRREAVKLLAVGGAAALVGCQRTPQGASGGGAASTGAATTVAGGNLPACVVRPELTVGPYFVDERLDRADIRSDPSTGMMREGVPLALAFNVTQVSSGRCLPLPGAMVDVWHCDARGAYSDVNDPGFNTAGQKFLRGYQVTDASGVAHFTTIYPGWYSGRSVHIHFKVRAPAAAVEASGTNQAYDFTSQLFFDEAVTDQVHAQPPYASKGRRDRMNAADGIYRQAGDQLLLTLAKAEQGYRAAFDIGLDLSDAETGRPDRMGRPPRRPPSE